MQSEAEQIDLPRADAPSAPGAAEFPSGKDAGDENFPVGSFLIPARLRPHVARFYAYARAIDDVADNAELAPEEKLRRLDGFAAAIRGETDDPAYIKAHRIAASLKETEVTTQHCLDLISAFKQDSVKGRYADWDELVDYCNRSAAPVGRYLLDLHGEDKAAYPYSDGLCNALQVINHLQDCQSDYRELDRVYLPGDWLEAEGAVVEYLDRSAATPAMRAVLDHTIAGTRELMAAAVRLPGALKGRLAYESAVIVKIAERLIVELERRDPLAERIELTKPQVFRCGVAGVISALLR
ncbi:MAG: squalene synthase HpnC [Sphingomonadales bacterium]|nr:squalene synthase HpnC [Sphingomonadales bacterium]